MNDRDRKGPPTRETRPRDVPAVDPELMALLGPDELQAIRDRARKQAQLEQKQIAEKQYFERALEEERRKNEPEQEMVGVTIDVAPFAKEIRLDGRVYHHGQRYDVPRAVYDTIQEITARGWAHDAEVGHPNDKYYTPPPMGTGNYAGVRGRPVQAVISPNNVEQVLGTARAKHGM